MLKKIKIAFFAAALAVGFTAPAAADGSQGYRVKAAFIINFLKFVEWPGDFAVSKQSAINICVIGDSPFSEQVKKLFSSSSALKVNLVEKGAWSGSAAGCHIAYISESESQKIPEITTALKAAPVLTVSDIEDFAERGGMIGFVAQNKASTPAASSGGDATSYKVKVAVNTNAATAAGLRVDAQLLEIAVKVIRN